MPKPTVCGVRVAMWGAEAGGHQGLGHHLESELFGGNCGHAALSLTIPVNPENTEMIKKYCGHPAIPVEKQIVRTSQAKQDKNGKWVPDLDAPPAHEEEVYTITFSWWPGTGAFFLNPTINSDGYDERTGVHRESDPRFIEIEERVHAGKLGRTKMTYGALNVEHARNLSLTSDQIKYLDLKAQQKMLDTVAKSLKVGIDKIEGKNKALKEIHERRQGAKDKEKTLSEKQADITLLTNLKSSLADDSKLVLSDKDKERLNNLYPDWETLKDKTKDKEQRKKAKSEINNKIIEIKNSIARIENDTEDKIKVDEAKLLKPSETEIILFDRFIPSWRQDFQFDKNNILTGEAYNQLLDKARDIRKDRKDKLVKVTDELDALDYVNLPPEAKDFGYELKGLMEDKRKLEGEKIILNVEIRKELELTDIAQMHDFFYTYLNSASDEYLEEGTHCVDIEGKIKDQLNEFAAKTGIDWKTIVKIEEDREVPRISKDEIDKIDDILFNHLKKTEALTFFEQYLNPDNPRHLKNDDILKIDDELMKHLNYTKRYAGKEWEKFIADKTQMTRRELKKLMKAAIDNKTAIEKAKDPLAPFVQLSNHFYYTYLEKGKSNEYLKKDNDSVDIQGTLQDKLNEFTKLTGIDWKSIVEIEPDRIPRASKNEIEQMESILFDCIKKVEALQYFEQFLDPLNPRYLKKDGHVKIDKQIKEYLEYADRYSGQPWESYVSDPDKKVITKKELRHLIKATKRHQLETDKSGKTPEVENKVGSREKINQLQVQIVNHNKQLIELNQKISALNSQPSLMKYKEYTELKNKYDKLEYTYDLVTDKLERKTKEDEKSFKIGKDLQLYLDNAYKFIPLEENWRTKFFNNPIPDPLVVDIKKLKEIQQHLAEKLKACNEEIITILPTRDCFNAQDHESFLTMGLPPEVEYKLRLDSDSLEDGAQWGMNAEKMLAQMHKIATDGVPFNLNVNNCSVTVGKVLEAGAKGEHLKSQFRNKALGAIATPQTIANNTEDYMRAYNKNPKDNILKRFARWSPIEQVIGKQVHTALSPDSSKEQQRNAWIKAGAIALVSSPLVLLKGLLTPTNTIRNSLNLIKFANSKDHAGFKAGAYIVGGLGMAVFAVPALIENTIKAPYNAIKWVTNKIESKRIRREDAHVDISQEELSSRKDKESQLKSNVSKTEENIIAIHSKDPIVALEQAEKEMSKGKIISFDAQTRLKIENHIQQVKDPQTKTELQNRYTDIINNSAGKVIGTVMQSNASSQNTAKDVRKHVRFSTPEKTNQVAVEPEQQLNPTSKNKSTNNK